MFTNHRGKCPGYDAKQSDGEVPVMLELWGMQSTPLLLSFPGPFCPEMVSGLNPGLSDNWWTLYSLGQYYTYTNLFEI